MFSETCSHITRGIFNKNFIVLKFFVKTEGVSILLNSRNGIVRLFLSDYIMNNK